MASRIERTGNAIVDLIEKGAAAGSLKFSLAAEFKYYDIWEIAENDRLSVIVFPYRAQLRQGSRSRRNDFQTFFVVAHRKFGSSAIKNGVVKVDEVNKHIEYLEQLSDYLADPDNRALPTETTAKFVEPGSGRERIDTNDLGITNAADPSDLSKHIYTGVIGVAYEWETAVS